MQRKRKGKRDRDMKGQERKMEESVKEAGMASNIRGKKRKAGGTIEGNWNA